MFFSILTTKIPKKKKSERRTKESQTDTSPKKKITLRLTIHIKSRRLPAVQNMQISLASVSEKKTTTFFFCLHSPSFL